MFELWRGQGLARGLFVAGWILSILGPLMVIAGIVGIINEQRFLRTASKAQGTIVEMVERNGGHGSTYAPVYAFRDASGQEQKVYSQCSSYPPAYQVGDKIEVLYNPRSPRDAQIESFFDMWGWKIGFAGMGLLNVVIGQMLIFFGRKQRKKAANQPSEATR